LPAEFSNISKNKGGKPEKILGQITGKGGNYYCFIIACILVLCNQSAKLFANVLVYFIPNNYLSII
jgi:hypothetical protein